MKNELQDKYIEDLYIFLEEINPNFNFIECNDFIESSALGSFDVVMLVDMIETHYKIEIDGLDILPENFKSIDSILALIRKCQKNDS